MLSGSASFSWSFGFLPGKIKDVSGLNSPGNGDLLGLFTLGRLQKRIRFKALSSHNYSLSVLHLALYAGNLIFTGIQHFLGYISLSNHRQNQTRLNFTPQYGPAFVEKWYQASHSTFAISTFVMGWGTQFIKCAPLYRKWNIRYV